MATTDAAAKAQPAGTRSLAPLIGTTLGRARSELVANLTLVFADIDLASWTLGTFSGRT